MYKIKKRLTKIIKNIKNIIDHPNKLLIFSSNIKSVKKSMCYVIIKTDHSLKISNLFANLVSNAMFYPI